MLNTISARQLQREYKKVLEEANKINKPLIVISNNQPQGAVIGLDLLEKLQLEIVVNQALEDSRLGKTKVIKTKKQLEKDLEELERYAFSKS